MTIITDYIGKGLHADRPASPSIASGETAIYYETDTGHTFVWSGAAWIQVDDGGGGGSPTIVQSKAAAGNIGDVTLDAAPTNRNLLVLFITGDTPTPAADWNKVPYTDSNGSTFSCVFWKIAGPSESATQTYRSGTSNVAVVMYEISGGDFFGAPYYGTASGTSATFSGLNVPVSPRGTGDILIGIAASDNSAAQPSSITGATAGVAADNGSDRAGTAFDNTSISSGVNNVTSNYGGSHALRIVAVVISAP